MSACCGCAAFPAHFLCDAGLELCSVFDYGKAYGADVAIMNGGGIRAALPRGEVSRGDVMAEGGDGYSMMPSCKEGKTPRKSDAKVLEDYLHRFNPFPMPETGRLIYK